MLSVAKQPASTCREKYGSWKVEIEKGKKEKRDGKGGQRSFRQFLDGYKHEDIYLVANILKQSPLIGEYLVKLQVIFSFGFF